MTRMWNGASLSYRSDLRFQNLRRTARSLVLPQYGNALRPGTKRVISCCQLWSVEAGAMTRNGPQMLCTSARYAMSEIDWTVLPSP